MPRLSRGADRGPGDLVGYLPGFLLALMGIFGAVAGIGSAPRVVGAVLAILGGFLMGLVAGVELEE